MTRLRFGLLLSAIGLTVAGCSSTPVTPPAATPAVAAPPVQVAAVGQTVSAAPSSPVDSAAAQRGVTPSVTTVSLLPHLDPKGFILSQKSVYFDFDDFSVKSEFTALLDRHGKYLASQPNLRIKVEGNADARGSANHTVAILGVLHFKQFETWHRHDGSRDVVDAVSSRAARKSWCAPPASPMPR